MPRYSFRSDTTGKIVELFYAMKDAPKIGSKVYVVGMPLTRIIDLPQIDCRQSTHFTSVALPRWDPNAKSHDAQGKPQFASKKDVDEYISKTEGDWVYD